MNRDLTGYCKRWKAREAVSQKLQCCVFVCLHLFESGGLALIKVPLLQVELRFTTLGSGAPMYVNHLGTSNGFMQQHKNARQTVAAYTVFFPIFALSEPCKTSNATLKTQSPWPAAVF